MKAKVASTLTTPASPPVERIARFIFLARGEKVLLDRDLAVLYGVETRTLNQAVQRNLDRFPEDFMFQLSAGESEIVLRSQIVISKGGRGGRRYRPYAFTEQGVAMLSSVLASSRAVQVNIAIMRTFVQLRQMLSAHADLARKLESLEKKYDAKFRVIFDAIREMTDTKKKPKREIGFHTLMPKPAKAGSAKSEKI